MVIDDLLTGKTRVLFFYPRHDQIALGMDTILRASCRVPFKSFPSDFGLPGNHEITMLSEMDAAEGEKPLLIVFGNMIPTATLIKLVGFEHILVLGTLRDVPSFVLLANPDGVEFNSNLNYIRSCMDQSSAPTKIVKLNQVFMSVSDSVADLVEMCSYVCSVLVENNAVIGCYNQLLADNTAELRTIDQACLMDLAFPPDDYVEFIRLVLDNPDDVTIEAQGGGLRKALRDKAMLSRNIAIELAEQNIVVKTTPRGARFILLRPLPIYYRKYTLAVMRFLTEARQLPVYYIEDSLRGITNQIAVVTTPTEWDNPGPAASLVEHDLGHDCRAFRLNSWSDEVLRLEPFNHIEEMTAHNRLPSAPAA